MSDHAQILTPVWPDAAKSLGGIGRNKMYRLCKEGVIPTVWLGGRRYVVNAQLPDLLVKLSQAPDRKPRSGQFQPKGRDQ